MSGVPASKATISSEMRLRCELAAPAIPSAQQTANVSSPSGTTSAINLAIVNLLRAKHAGIPERHRRGSRAKRPGQPTTKQTHH